MSIEFNLWRDFFLFCQLDINHDNDDQRIFYYDWIKKKENELFIWKMMQIEESLVYKKLIAQKYDIF